MIQFIKVFVFSHSASVDGFGQLTNKFFLMQNDIIPFSMVSHFGAPGGGGGILSFMEPAETKVKLELNNFQRIA